VLETEQMWKDHQLKREVQKQDEVLGKDLPHQREVRRQVAHLLEQSYAAIDQRKFDRAIKLCDEILMIDPNYPVARELRDDVEKSRHKEEYWSLWAGKLAELKRQTQDDEEPMLPKAMSMKVPSREEWGEVSKRLSKAVIKTEGGDAKGWEGAIGKLKAKPDVASPVAPPAETERPREVTKPEPKPEPKPVVPAMTKEPRIVLREPAKLDEPAPSTPLTKPGPNPVKPLPVVTMVPAAPAKSTPPPPPDTTTSSLIVRNPRAEELYKFAERRFQEGEFERSNEALQEALKFDPNDAPSRALFAENSFILGKGKATPSTQEYDRFMHEALTRNARAGKSTDLPDAGFLAVDPEVTRKEMEAVYAADLLSLTGSADRGDFFYRGFKAARINDLQRELDAANTLATKYEADMQVFVRQMEVQLAQVEELTTRVEETRAKLYKSLNEKSLAIDPTTPEIVTYRNKLKQQMERDMAELELKKIELSVAGVDQDGTHVNTAPLKATKKPWADPVAQRSPKGLSEMHEELNDEDKTILEKVRSTRVSIDVENAPLTALVDHLRQSTGLNIHIVGGPAPDSEAVTVKVNDTAVDQVLRQALEARGRTYQVRDGVVLIVPSEQAQLSCVAVGLRMEVASISEDESRIVLKGQLVAAGQICAVTRAGKFVALVRVERISGDQTEARVLRELTVGRILPGDKADVVTNARGYLARLPLEVRMDLASRASQQTIRAKMGLKE
jgi:tetratricopeptide (TPR) repeat protein